MQCGIDDPRSGILDIYISLAYTERVVLTSLNLNQRDSWIIDSVVSGQRFSTLLFKELLSLCIISDSNKYR